MMSFHIKCVLFIFTCCVQEGLSGGYKVGPHLGAEEHLQRAKRQSKAAKSMLKVTGYHVRCALVSRYALTTVRSSVWNPLPVTKEAAFEVDLPASAFISNFTITSDGKVHVAQVQERTAARKMYDAAKKQGKTAGLVATKEREIEKFRVAVSVPPGAEMSFSLSYEELLPRRLGHYELSLGLRPGQPVQNLTLDVIIEERTGISFLRVLPLKTSRLMSNTVKAEAGVPPSTHVEHNAGYARVRYSPTLQQQNAVSSRGLNVDFIIQYDVELRDLIGDIQVYDGYFVHYFAPRGLPVVPKDVIFVIDVSGSMIGTKIKQTKQAMHTILGDLREADHFNIITFSDKVHTWRKGRTVRATRHNVRDAKDFVRRIIAEGWTNINAALLSAAQLVNPRPSGPPGPASSSDRRVPLVIFLTDGEATVGVTTGDVILGNAHTALGSASLFGLAFGDDADLPLLRRLALENRGVARMVYEDADAALQLKGFYDEVASPLLSDVQLSYLDDRAFDVSRSLFPHYFQGSELVVAGRLRPGPGGLKVSLSAVGAERAVKVERAAAAAHGAEGNGVAGSVGGRAGISSFVRRLWAYLTIKELLQAKLNATDQATQRLLTDKATKLSLKYNFVTPVTSLVVVKPDEDQAARRPATTTATTTTSKPVPSTTTVTTTTSKAPAHANAKKPNPPSNPRTNKSKPDVSRVKTPLPQPPPPPPGIGHMLQPRRSPSLPTATKTTTPSSSKKHTTTASPSSVRTPPAPLSGKIPAPAAPDSRRAPKASNPLHHFYKTAHPPAPGKTSTAPYPTAAKTATAPLTTDKTPKQTSTTPATSTVAPVQSLVNAVALAPPPALTAQPPPSSSTAPPPARLPRPTSEAENGTVMEARPLEVPTVMNGLRSALDARPTPAPEPGFQDDNDTTDTEEDVEDDMEVRVATLLSGTFAPMPGVTDGPKPWEAAGLLDVSTSIQIQRKDMDLVKDYDAIYDYDYDINYDSWEDTANTESFGSPSTLSSVRVFSSSVDGDPHFVVQLPKLHQNLCFTVDGRPKDVLRLLEDPERGIIVDGHLIGAPFKLGAEDRPRTYFHQLVISSSKGGSSGVMITLTLDAVVVEGEGRDILSVNQPGFVTRQGVSVAVDKQRNCWIEMAKDVRFLVLFHHYKHPSYLQVSHLGFYIANGRGLSSTTEGLLGQFQHIDMSVTTVTDRADSGLPHPHHSHNQHPAKEGVLARGELRLGSTRMQVTLQDKSLKDTARKRHGAKCWVVPKAEVERLLGRPYHSYVVERL
ncbi:inter-alpha-trypsin inhibitor heavy chain H5 isoform X1 [Gadus morhua]|uniref:Inter-alpha-trypsin inhibitor heavy chain family member 6 n=1 Tax=Gadus morhua TaxID=8049 RepID=A0A8C4YZR8_GADMO|nr:inter-alpha-trypsin inhibitor heavy chain H6 isoform X1 [Gadus morhua]